MIDRLREQLQHRLEQLTAEADRVRKALAALDPRPSSSPSKPAARTAPARKPARTSADGAAAAATAPTRSTAASADGSARRTAPGATKAAVLAALADGEAMTAGQVAERTGLGRATVSTTLSKLAKSGEVQKADRGYRLASTATATSPQSGG